MSRIKFGGIKVDVTFDSFVHSMHIEFSPRFAKRRFACMIFQFTSVILFRRITKKMHAISIWHMG
jgi:hypothetical protein